MVEELRDDGDHVLVMKSTVPAGHRRRRSAATCPGLAYVSCPEFLKEGSAVEDFMHPDRVVIGADPGDEEAGDAVAALYEPLGGEIVRTDVASAEMIKLASNAFLATKISFINEIANVCEEVGADVGEVARGMGLDERIGASFLRAGIGYGRQLLPQGRQRAEDAGRQHRLPLPAAERGDRGQRAAEAARRRQAREAPRLAASASGSRCSASPSSPTPTTCARPRAWCWRRGCRARGPRSSPTTRSPASAAGELLGSVEMADSALEALDGADAAVLVTEWPEFAELDWAEAAERMARPLLVDGRNFLDAGGAARPPASSTRASAAPGRRRPRRPPTRCRRSSWSAARGRGCGR